MLIYLFFFKDIQKSINDLSTKPKSLITKLCEEILVRINLLEKKATDAMIYLPGYDQRQSILVCNRFYIFLFFINCMV